MAYIVLQYFEDLQDGCRAYRAGETYPRPGFAVSSERIAELSGPANRRGIPLIAEELKTEHNCADPTTHSTELCHMTKAQLRALAKERGLGEIKPTMLKADMIELLEGGEDN